MTFKGDTNTNEHYWPSLTAKKCNNSSSCKTEEEINEFVSKATVYTFIMTETYNSKNLEKPVEKLMKFYSFYLQISNDVSYEQTSIQITQESL